MILKRFDIGNKKFWLSPGINDVRGNNNTVRTVLRPKKIVILAKDATMKTDVTMYCTKKDLLAFDKRSFFTKTGFSKSELELGIYNCELRAVLAKLMKFI